MLYFLMYNFKWKDYHMNYSSKVKSHFCILMLGTIIATSISTTHMQALSSQSVRAWIGNHRLLCFAAVTIPTFGLYARHTIADYFIAQKRQPDTTKKPEKIDYFDKFTEAFNKTLTLVGKVFKVVRAATSDDTKWLDDMAGL